MPLTKRELDQLVVAADLMHTIQVGSRLFVDRDNFKALLEQYLVEDDRPALLGLVQDDDDDP